jgi:TPR repeat protein
MSLPQHACHWASARRIAFLVAAALAGAAGWAPARADEATTQLRIGLMHYHGQGVPEDEVKAIEWLKRSAAQGNHEAMYQIANILTFGSQAHHASYDPDVEAARWYFEAARAGYADAQYALGLLFLAGKGVFHSREEGLAWIRNAAAQGHPEAERFASAVEPQTR